MDTDVPGDRNQKLKSTPALGSGSVSADGRGSVKLTIDDEL